MYNSFPIEHLELASKYITEWNTQNPKGFVVITAIEKQSVLESNVINHFGQKIVLKKESQTIAFCVTGLLPTEIQKVANSLKGYRFFNDANTFNEYISEITKA
jgi:hypothetical protein